jgi:hypothetical protein
LSQLVAGPKGAKNRGGGKVVRLIQIRLATPSFEKIGSACQDNLQQVRTAASSSWNAINLSLPRTTKRFSVSTHLARKDTCPAKIMADEVAALGMSINSGAQFALADIGSGIVPIGTVFAGINNTSANPIARTFSNLSDGVKLLSL